MLEKLQACKEIYLFASKLKAACIEQPPNDYLLFTTKELIETISNQYQIFPLLKDLSISTTFSISIGIGYGDTAEETKENAQRAMKNALASGRNSAYIIGKNLSSRVPMSKNRQLEENHENLPTNEQFLYLSRKADLSYRIITNLYHICLNTGRYRFTSSELADLANVSPRTMNRIVNKLMLHHLAQEVGMQCTTKSGRPSRIIELQFEAKRRIRRKS